MTSSPILLDGRALLDADRLLRAGIADRRASFELTVRRMPAHTGFAVVAGVELLLDRLARSLVNVVDLARVQRVIGLSDELAARLTRLSPTLDIDAVPDGTLAFAQAPIISVEGPFLEAILVGRLVQVFVQRGTAIATHTARLHIAAGGESIVEGSSARTTSPEEAIAVARAAFIGGASSTTNALAAAALSIPFRAESKLDLGTLAAAKVDADGWGDSPADRLIELGTGDDEEAILIEAKRLGTHAGGWIARGLAESVSLPSMRYELVALEEAGAWSPRRGTSGDADVVPGRKRLARYTDANGRAVADVIHMTNERMQPPKTVGAVTVSPLARAVLRHGRTLETREPPSAGRERAIAVRQSLSPAITYLRRPATYRVDLSPALLALSGEPAR